MKRVLTALAIVVALTLTAGAVALSYASTRGVRKMVGVVTRMGAASITATDQLGAQGGVVIDRVVVPEPSWVAVYTEVQSMGGMGGGALVGVTHVPAGESRDVRITLDPNVRLSEHVIAIAQADRGIPGTFEFDPKRFDSSPDKPYWAGGRQVQVKIWVRFWEMGNSFKS